MKNLRDSISQKADIMPQVIPGLFYSVNHTLWDAIDEQVWFGVHDVVRGHTPVSIPSDLVIIKTNRPE